MTTRCRGGARDDLWRAISDAWGLVVIVTIKYVLVMLQADNDGEGGTLSLMALASGLWVIRALHGAARHDGHGVVLR